MLISSFNFPFIVKLTTFAVLNFLFLVYLSVLYSKCLRPAIFQIWEFFSGFTIFAEPLQVEDS